RFRDPEDRRHLLDRTVREDSDARSAARAQGAQTRCQAARRRVELAVRDTALPLLEGRRGGRERRPLLEATDRRARWDRESRAAREEARRPLDLIPGGR